MKKSVLAGFVVCMLLLGATGAQAAFVGLSTGSNVLLGPGSAGSFQFAVYLLNEGTLPNVDAFDLSLQATSAASITMSPSGVAGPALTNYIFSGNSFSFIAVNPGGTLTNLGIGDATASGSGVTPLWGHDLLAMITVNYPALTTQTALNFSLQPLNQNFIVSSTASGSLVENLTLAAAPAVPLPGAVWLFATGIMGLVGVRRKFMKQ